MRCVSAGATCAAARRWVMPFVLVPLAAAAGPMAASGHAPGPLSHGVSAVSAGDTHSCAIERGKAFCWGDNTYGELGVGGITQSAVPVAVNASGVLAGKTLTHIAAGDDFTCALDSAGAAYCWGTNYAGALGNGSAVSSSSAPVAVDTGGVLAGKTLTQISASAFHACVLDSAGTA
jgi:alpha-tubulin suppressor-like RCC1 family protein